MAELKKYLDKAGLQILWDSAKAKFIDNAELTAALANYPTKAELATELAKYYTKAEIDAFFAEVETKIAKKVDKEITSTSGKALIFNEADGGGAKFEHTDGSEAFVGVNNGGQNGLMAQIYADKLVDGKWQGAKLDVYNDGIYYTTGNQSAAERRNPDNELVVWADIKNIPGGMRFIGVGELAAGQELEAAIKATYEANGYAYPGDRKVGDIVILKDNTMYREFIYTSAGWEELGDSSLYATKEELAAEALTRSTSDAELETSIAAEETRAKGVEATKADLPGECPPWLNPTGETPYPRFMASLDVESTGKGPDAAGNLNVGVGAYNFNMKQYYKWDKSLPFAATTSKAGLMVAADKDKLDNIDTLTQQEIEDICK